VATKTIKWLFISFWIALLFTIIWLAEAGGQTQIIYTGNLQKYLDANYTNIKSFMGLTQVSIPIDKAISPKGCKIILVEGYPVAYQVKNKTPEAYYPKCRLKVYDFKEKKTYIIDATDAGNLFRPKPEKVTEHIKKNLKKEF